MKLKIFILSLFVCSLVSGQTLTEFKKQATGSSWTIVQLQDAFVRGMGGFSTPVPTTDLLGYWSASRDGIITGDTILLKSVTGVVVAKLAITGRDWTDRFIPLKTAATFKWVGTPTIDTAFWKHDIYPTTVFSDIDYNHQTFFKVLTQTLDGNGVETISSRITEIAIYSVAKATTDLATLTAYFSVPSIATTGVIWVSKTGNNTTGNGSKASPYLTINKANTQATTGDTVYVTSGYYREVDYLYISKAAVFQGVGRIYVTSDGADYVLRTSLTTGANMKCMMFDGQTKAFAHYLSGSITLNNCYFTGGPFASRAVNVVNNCRVDQEFHFVTGNTTVTNSFFNTTKKSDLGTNGNSYSFTNSIFNLNTTTQIGIDIAGNCSMTLKGCRVNFVTGTYGITSSTTKTGSIFSATYCSFYPTNITYTSIYLRDYPFTSVLLDRCTLDNKSNQVFVNLVNQLDVDITNCTMISDILYPIMVSTATQATNVNISSNFIKANYQDGYAIKVGSETTATGNDVMDSVKIERNIIYGQKYYNSSATPGCHGIFVGFQGTKVRIRYNNVIGTGIGIITKGSNTDGTNTIISYNLVKDSYLEALYTKGVDKVKFYNNTTVNNSKEFYASVNTGSDAVNDIEVKNNIFYNTSGYIYVFDLGSYSLPNVIDYNTVYFTDKLCILSADVTWPELQLAGYDVHSYNQNPNFTSASQLWPITQFDGADLTSTYNTGLDISTSWPIVVTKQQGATWQIGAYVK
jgi:hypothetical protein